MSQTQTTLTPEQQLALLLEAEATTMADSLSIGQHH